jgi:hypothetical protein
MNTLNAQNSKIRIAVKWLTNMASLTLLALVSFIIISHESQGLPAFSELSVKEIQLFIGMGLLFAGALIGIRWRLMGGVVAVLGYAFFAIVEQTVLLGWVFNVFLLIGIINILLSQWKKRKS